MKIIVNGQEKEVAADFNLKQLIEHFRKDSRHVIAEVNGQIVKTPTWEDRQLFSGDRIELVNFVGGG